MNRILITIIAICFVLPPTISAQANTGTEILQSCELLLRGMRGEGEKVVVVREGILCWNYMEAVQDVISLGDENSVPLLKACIPSESSLTQLIRIFVAFGQANPAELHKRASVLVMRALWKAFPCN